MSGCSAVWCHGRGLRRIVACLYLGWREPQDLRRDDEVRRQRLDARESDVLCMFDEVFEVEEVVVGADSLHFTVIIEVGDEEVFGIGEDIALGVVRQLTFVLVHLAHMRAHA